MDMDINELECRICRGNGEQDRPLYNPCLCSGSIGLVHQDCLEAWLEHSKKEHCELCSTRYTFEPFYDENAPERIPLLVLAVTLVRMLLFTALPFLFRSLMAVIIWLFLVPIGTISFYRTFMRSGGGGVAALPVFSVQTVAFGLLLDALIALSLLILMSFTDFVRFHWVQEEVLPDNHPQLPQGMPVPAPEEVRQLDAVVDEAEGRDEEEDNMSDGSDWTTDNEEVDEEVDVVPEPGPPPPPPLPQWDFPQAQAQAQEGAAADGNPNPAFPDLEEPLDPNANIEVRLALLELLGLHGPLYVMARNAVWLLAFVSVYLALVACIPRVIGKIVINLLAAKLTALGVTSMDLSMPAEAEDDGVPLQAVDFLQMLAGYGIVLLIIFILSASASALPSTLLAALRMHIQQLATVSKVSVLLVVRIFFLPLVQGALLLHTLSSALGISMTAWQAFIQANAVGAFGLTWAVGITFMLTMTVSILQLREILHPQAMAAHIRPQEAHVDLIHSLITESGVLHAKRILASVCVYVLLSLLLVGLPCLIYLRAFGTSEAVTIHTWYALPVLQLPVELAILHLCFLNALDRYKDSVGKAIAWTVRSYARMLGMETALLPYTPEGALARPPAGWDTRSAVECSRWAWGEEEASALQKAVLPMAPASLLGYLTFGGMLYLTTVLCLGGVVLGPLLLGRALTSAVYLPSALMHDPLHYLLGAKVLLGLGEVAQSMRPGRWPSAAPFGLALRLLAMRLLTYLSAGCLLSLMRDLLLHPSPPSAAEGVYDLLFVHCRAAFHPAAFPLAIGLPLSALGPLLLKLTLRGLLIVEGALYVALSGRWGMRAMAFAPEGIHAVLGLGLGLDQLQALEETVIMPSFETIAVEGNIVLPFFTSMVYVLAELCASQRVQLLEPMQAYRLARISSLAVYLFYRCPLAQQACGIAAAQAAELYQRIRDDNYLIGRRLVNNDQPHAHVHAQ